MSLSDRVDYVCKIGNNMFLIYDHLSDEGRWFSLWKDSSNGRAIG